MLHAFAVILSAPWASGPPNDMKIPLVVAPAQAGVQFRITGFPLSRERRGRGVFRESAATDLELALHGAKSAKHLQDLFANAHMQILRYAQDDMTGGFSASC